MTDHTRCRNTLTEAISALSFATGMVEGATAGDPPPFLQQSIDNMVTLIGEFDNESDSRNDV